MPIGTGPLANLPGTARRQGRGGTVYRDGLMLGNVIAVDWDVEAEAEDVLIPGRWQTEQIAGGESRRFTLRYQDVDDGFRLQVWRFFEARRQGDFTSQPPTFDLQTNLVGGPVETRWALIGCQIFGYSGGYSNEDGVLVREVTGSFRSDKPLQAFTYTDGGVSVTSG